MQLKDFTANTIETATEAKNFLSFLIGYNFNKKTTGKALIAVYESFSQEIKEQPKILAPSMFKFFSNYEITPENHEIYKKFLPFWSPKEKEVIKNKNKNWNFENEKTVYKNSLEFCRTLQRLSRWNISPKDGIDFLKNNKKVLTELILKDKNKFQDNMEKIGAWEMLIKNDYSYFKEICKNKFDEKSILIKVFEKHPLIICSLDEEKFSYILKDMKDYQIFDSLKDDLASDVLTGLIIGEKYLNAAHFRVDFEDNINNSMNKNSKNKLSCMKEEDLKEFFQEYLLHRERTTMSWQNIDKSKQNLDVFFSLAQKFEFKDSLEQKLELNNDDKKKPKKMKI